MLVLDAGYAPENMTAALRHFAPQLVLLIDAAEMGEAPGVVRWIGMEEIAGMSASTHSLPLSMLAEYLTLELGCRMGLLGIQPASNDIGEFISAAVKSAVEELTESLTAALQV
jgi:hydrogenase 3 maturation protease